MTRPLEATAVAAFADEFGQSLPIIVTALDAAERDRSDRAAVREAYRLIHALKGAASMVGLAAFGFLLNVAEELIEESVGGTAPLSDEAVAVLRASLPRFGSYIDAALSGRPIDGLAFDLIRLLHSGDITEQAVTLRALLEVETREIALLKKGPAEAAAPVPEASAPEVIPPAIPWVIPTEIASVIPTEIASVIPTEIAAVIPSVASDAPASSFESFETGAENDRREPPPTDREATTANHVIALPVVGPAAPEPELVLAPTEEVSPELAEVFGQEAHEHLEAIARFTSGLSPDSDDREAIQELRRAVHTLKGAAGVVGYKGASRLAHRMEDVLDRLYEGTATVTSQVVRVLASSSDALHDLILGTSDPTALRAGVARLFTEFDSLVSGVPVPAPGDAPAGWDGPSTPSPEPAVAADPVAVVVMPDGQPIVERRRMTERRRALERRSGGHVLRVPMQRLDELVRVVSELVINRSTFEQHHAGLIEQVDELKLSTARLRRVTHKLESDYEARALAGNMAMVGSGSRSTESAGAHGFDELEFDRYTDFHLLTRELAETASDIATISARVAGTIGDFDGDLTRLSRLTREVQDKTMEFRMVPFGTLTAQLERAVRTTAESCGKLVDCVVEGEQVALDKSLLEQMADPLLHLLRNSVDHGIEFPETRLAVGKRERGQITVRAFHEGTDVLIEVQDDGAGLDLERIRTTAIARGFLAEADAASMAADAVYGFIFEPGFSTAQHVSEVSGRGVGMDVVKSKVGRLGGRVQVASQSGAGATMSVRVPMTMAITRILLGRAGGQTFGLPLSAVVQIVRPHPSAIGQVGAERVLTVDGQTYPLRDLAETLGLPRGTDPAIAQPVLIANLSRRRVALALDEILNSRDAVVKTLGTHLRRVPGVWGATLLGDGTVVLILNPADLAGSDERPSVRVARPRLVAAAERLPHTVLIVDDSLSMRHVLSVAVTKAGWTAVPARDGLEALEVLHRSARPPDLVLLDIEMPRMDGFEFLSTVRAQKAYADLPIIMLTSRGGDKHRDKARALGVTDYMVKPFQEDVLISNIDRLVQASRGSERRVAS